MARHHRGVFVEPEFNGIVPVSVWLSTGERALRTEYLAKLLTPEELDRLHRELQRLDPLSLSLVG